MAQPQPDGMVAHAGDKVPCGNRREELQFHNYWGGPK